MLRLVQQWQLAQAEERRRASVLVPELQQALASAQAQQLVRQA